ncbi:uncharacterized protein FA14DRAFT_162013 [Meira miltonrushii]|uniref:Transcription factor domain-containing protein n=1 Tax=Meira miltonrushii TaxID=1280837 RepID=A0A316VAW6_9BASI|nr:uncharacterized protein FA14DRAFT_162013 [Meira miltonrushii]PWN32685.1 hypothetical protein FA14DRAFT_162013 [Meira miltonrushii]
MGLDCTVDSQGRTRQRRATPADRNGITLRDSAPDVRDAVPDVRSSVPVSVPDGSNLECIPASYNFIIVEAGGLPISKRRTDALKATANDRVGSLIQLDWLIDDRLSALISTWSEKELGSLMPLLPPPHMLRSQRKEANVTDVSAMDPALLILELGQYLCAARHLYLPPEQHERYFPGVQVEVMVRPILHRCLSQLIISSEYTPSMSLAFQLLCVCRFERCEKRIEPPYALLSSAVRMSQIARSSSTTERHRLAMDVLCCSAYTLDLSYILGTREGLTMYRSRQYEGISPTLSEVEGMIGNVEKISSAGYVGIEEQVALSEQRVDALRVLLNRTVGILTFSQAWQDIWMSTKALREDKKKHSINDEEQLICLAQTGHAMSKWDFALKRLAERRAYFKGKISQSVSELMEVEAQLSGTILLGHCLRTQIESTIDVDVPTEFDGIGHETALLAYVRMMLAENMQGARELFPITQTRLEAGKAVLVEQTGRLADDSNRQRSNNVTKLETGYPALVSLGHFFEAAALVLEAHAPHLAVSRSTLASHDSWALLAWAVKGLVTSLLLCDTTESETTPSTSSHTTTPSMSPPTPMEKATLIVERHCQHVEARMVLDLPFPLPSTQIAISDENPIELA